MPWLPVVGELDALEGFRALNRPFQVFPNGATQPDVRGWDWWKASNTAPTTITAFLNGVSAQELLVIATNGNTTVQDESGGSNIKLAGGADKTLATDEVLRLLYDGVNWYEA